MDMFGSITVENRARIKTQNKRKIPVIIGNPPYNANQKNANDNNSNEAAPIVDGRIRETYLKASTAQKTKLYDPYIRFFRWASDRLGDKGILAFITNRSFLSGRSFDGFRKTIANEFQELWLVDLLGDLRSKDNSLINQGGNIFAIQTGVAIGFLIRNPKLDGCEIHYLHAPAGISGLEKLQWLRSEPLRTLAKTGEFSRIISGDHGEWLNQPHENWNSLLPVLSKEVKSGKSDEAIFKMYSLGIVTSRDDWVYGHSKSEVLAKVQYFIEFYQSERKRLTQHDLKNIDIEIFVKRDIKWTTELTAYLIKGTKLQFRSTRVISGSYRPFVNKFMYYERIIVHRTYQQLNIFPIGINIENLAICTNGATSNTPFGIIAVTKIPDLHFYGDTTTLPFWVYDKDGTCHDNITDWVLNQFQTHYSSQAITKLAIFNYVYAVLHDPRYRAKYALNLKAEFPRIPFHPDFIAWADIGAQLIQLHAYFEQVTPWDGIKRIDLPGISAIKCRLKADKTKNTIEIDTVTRLENIPAQAWQYQLGNRSALEWVLDQYKEKTPKDPTIREKFNTYRFTDYKEQVIELLGKVCRVSVETMRLIDLITNYEF